MFLDSELKTITGVERESLGSCCGHSFAGYAAWLRRSKGLFYYGVLCGGYRDLYCHDAAVCKGRRYPADDGSILPALCFYPVVSWSAGQAELH